MQTTEQGRIHEVVRERYAAAARDASGCCSPGATTENPLVEGMYDQDAAALPDAAVAASLGCANPTALAALREGETVLDLGSGGGIDVLLSARRVGPTGFVYGLDMTDEMLALAERNRAEAGAQNVRFLKGRIEEVPLPDASVDVIISNCVVNLSPDKDAVLREAFRVLRPGGRLAIADIATLGELPAAIRASMEAWAGCVAGALGADEYREKLRAAGFAGAELEVVRRYGRADLEAASGCSLGELGLEDIDAADISAAEGQVASVFVRARKPA